MTGKNQQTIMRLIRLSSGIILGVIVYQMALLYATVDCETIQYGIRYGGHMTALKILFGLVVLSCLGIPAAICGLLAGLLLGPIIGGPFASLAVLVSPVMLCMIGRYAGHMPWARDFVERNLASQAWFQRSMTLHSMSGFHWVTSQAIISKVPLPIFALLIGTKVKHLTTASFIAGIFASSVFYIAGYALAGASIGCAVINHALGVSFDQYKNLTLISCVILVILSKVQSYVEGKSES